MADASPSWSPPKTPRTPPSESVRGRSQQRRLLAGNRPLAEGLRPVDLVRRHWRTLLLLFLFGAALVKGARALIPLFRWAEARVDSNSTRDMAIFLAISQVFFTGLPIPIVLQVPASLFA